MCYYDISGMDGVKMETASAFFAPLELHQPTLPHGVARKLSSTIFKPTKYTIMSHTISGNIDSFNINNSFNKVWNNCTVADEDSGILAWLSPLEPHIRHHDIRTRRVDKVGDWFLQTREYQNWLGGIGQDGSDGRALFCYGGPGVGKSYIR